VLTRFSKEGVGGLDAVGLAHFNLPILNHVGDLRIENGLAQRVDRLDTRLFEGHESEAATAPRHFVAHDCHVDHFAEALEISLDVSLYTHHRALLGDPSRVLTFALAGQTPAGKKPTAEIKSRLLDYTGLRPTIK